MITKHGARSAVIAGLGIALAIGMSGSPAYASSPSVDGTPSNPIVTVDQTKTYAPGDSVTVDVSQTVGTEKYSEFVLSDVIDSGVLDITNEPAHVYKIDSNGNRTEVNNAGTYTYDSATKTLSFSFSDDYLKNKMAHDGKTTYVLEYKLKVAGSEQLKDIANGNADALSFDVGAASTVAVDGHDAYAKGASARTINIDADAHSTESDFNPLSYLTEMLASMFSNHDDEYTMSTDTKNTNQPLSQASDYKSHVSLKQAADTANENEATLIPSLMPGTMSNVTFNNIPSGQTGSWLALYADDSVDGKKLRQYTYTITDKNDTSKQTAYTFKLDDSVSGLTADSEASTSTDSSLSNLELSIDGTKSDTFKYNVLSYKVPSNLFSWKQDNSSDTKTDTNTDTKTNTDANASGDKSENANENTNGNTDNNTTPTVPTVAVPKIAMSLDSTTVNPGGTVSGTMTIESADGTTALTDAKNISISSTDSGVTVSNVKSTYTPSENAPTKVVTTFDVAVPASLAGKQLTLTGGIGSNTQSQTFTVAQPAINGTLTADNTQIETGGTVSFTTGGTVSNGTASNIKRTMTINAPAGSTISADGSATINDNTITWTDASADGTLASHTVKVTVPDTAKTGGKTVTASGTITSDNTSETTMGGNPTVNIMPNMVNGTLTTSTDTIDAGDSFDVDVSAALASGHIKNGKLVVAVSSGDADNTNALQDITIDDTDGVIKGRAQSGISDGKPLGVNTIWTVTYDLGTLNTSVSHVIHVHSVSGAAGGSIGINGTITSDTTADYDLGNKIVNITKPSVSGMTTLSNATPSAGDTLDFTVTPSVKDGNAKNLATTVTVANADGATITADGGTVSGNTVTFPAVSKLNGDGSKMTVHVALPDDGSLNGKTITFTANSKADNVASTQVGDKQSATVQTPKVTLKSSATAVSSKAAVDGKTVDSDGGTSKADDTSTSNKTDTSTDATNTSPATDTSKDSSKQTTDGKGDSDTSAITNPEEQADANLVVNNGDEIEYNATVEQSAESAYANNVTLTNALDDYSAKNGVYIEPDSLSIKQDGTDVTSKYASAIKWTGDSSQPTGFTLNAGRLGKGTLTVTYKASTGKANNDLLRGKTITNTTSVTGTNFNKPDAAKVDVVIASASLQSEILTASDTAKIGDNIKYANVITNDSTDTSSIAKNIYAAVALDDYASSIGVGIDPSSLQILSIENGKATDITKNVTIKWNDTKGFSVDTNVNLAASKAKDSDIQKIITSTDDTSRYAGIDHALVILYDANTADVNKDVYGDNDITMSLITRADNATYAAANRQLKLVAYDAPEQQELEGGSISDTDGTNGSKMTQTGDAITLASIGTAIAAGIAAITVKFRRRK